MSNIATTIEQSNFLRFKLDQSTADMVWRYKMPGGYSLEVLHNEKFETIEQNDIPAWSLSALLEVMPKVIVHDMNKHVLCLKYAEGSIPLMYYVVENGRNKGKLIRFDNGRCAPDAGDALDAAYQMVCWLLENNLIKKGGNNGTYR